MKLNCFFAPLLCFVLREGELKNHFLCIFLLIEILVLLTPFQLHENRGNKHSTFGLNLYILRQNSYFLTSFNKNLKKYVITLDSCLAMHHFSYCLS